MLICLDVGNTHIFGGIYDGDKMLLQFRYPSSMPSTSDQMGIFFKSVIRENNLSLEQIKKIMICSVVPSLNYSIRSAFLKYFSLDPFFLEVDSGRLSIDFKNYQEMGADRISTSIAAIDKFPGKNMTIIDFGTATTFDIISANKVYLGGVIIPGIYIAMKSLHENTAKLSSVDIVKPQGILGQTTAENIQAGLYFSHLGAAREILKRIQETAFAGKEMLVIGTGGFAQLFEGEKLFTAVIPELVLHGLYIASKAD